MAWFNTLNWAEWTGMITGLLYLVFSIRRSAWLWVMGFCSSLAYLWVFYKAGLYGQSVLQIYYLIISVYGWISWTRGSQTPSDNGKVTVETLTPVQMGLALIAVLAVFVLAFVVLNGLSESLNPAADAFMMAGCTIATWLLARRFIENWLIFIITDLFSIFFYGYVDMYPTALLFTVYTIMAVIGYLNWRRTLRHKQGINTYATTKTN